MVAEAAVTAGVGEAVEASTKGAGEPNTSAGVATMGSVTSCDTDSSAIKDLTSSSQAHWDGAGNHRNAPVNNTMRAAPQNTLEEAMRPQGMLMPNEPRDGRGSIALRRGCNWALVCGSNAKIGAGSVCR